MLAAPVAALLLLVLLVRMPATAGAPTLSGLLPAIEDASSVKVALIVGPVGEELTPVYIEIAEAAATRAEELGASVARSYSPNATPENVLAAMEDANVVVYLGHGVGFPNPYSATLRPDKVNGFGLQGPNARGDHADSWQDGTLQYYGESWLAANARPAPGWVMIHSNVCYAPGAGEGFDAPATEEIAATRVANYSRAPLLEMGASAYFATDFYLGAAEIIGTILSRPDATYGEVFASESRYRADAVTRVPHPIAADGQIWLHRSPYFEGKVDYWYAFAGDPTVSAASSRAAVEEPAIEGPITEEVTAESTLPLGGLSGRAGHHPSEPIWEEHPTVALAEAYAGEASSGAPMSLVVCADRCALVLVVDVCECQSDGGQPTVVSLSDRAWRLVTDRPPSAASVPITVYGAVEPPLVELAPSGG